MVVHKKPRYMLRCPSCQAIGFNFTSTYLEYHLCGGRRCMVRYIACIYEVQYSNQ